jgi:orotidine-5'-phosphate decarboxylase
MLVKQCIIVALELAESGALFQLVDSLDPQKCRLKVGKALFTRYGPSLLRQLQARGFDIFLDLKFHDIPHTVAQAVTAAADLGVWMITLHTSGGPKMLEAAVMALNSFNAPVPHLVGVTLLTSLNEDDLPLLGMTGSVSQQVERLASLAKNCGLDGVVCSAQEARRLKVLCGSAFMLVTPGIRAEGLAVQDQQRLMTPQRAIEAGADYLVIGRPITQAVDPAAALEEVQALLTQRYCK